MNFKLNDRVILVKGNGKVVGRRGRVIDANEGHNAAGNVLGYKRRVRVWWNDRRTIRPRSWVCSASLILDSVNAGADESC